MKKNYSVFFIFELEPIYFYLWVNFVDLVFKNFSMDKSLIVYEEKWIEMFEYVLITISNTLNIILLILAVITYFYYIYKHNC